MTCPYCNQDVWINNGSVEKCYGCAYTRAKQPEQGPTQYSQNLEQRYHLYREEWAQQQAVQMQSLASRGLSISSLFGQLGRGILK